jgi:hypothetical protein
MATVTTTYRASSNLTVTNLNSLASAAGLLIGWTSGTIDNTSDMDLDKVITAKFTTAASNRQAGQIQVWAYAMLDDSNWPDLFSAGTEGTEGTCTIHDDEQKNECMVLLWSTAVDTGASDVHNMPPVSLRSRFGDYMPAKCALFVTTTAATSTNAGLAASGNQVTVKGVYETVA